MIDAPITARLASVALVVLPILAFGTLWRVLAGPTTFDRIAAFDAGSVLLISWLAALSIARRSTSYVDAALGLAVLSFVGTLAAVEYLAPRDPGAEFEEEQPEREEESGDRHP